VFGEGIMPKDKKKTVQTQENVGTVEPEKKASSEKTQEDKIKTYITEYIDSYMNSVEELSIDEADFPLFYTYYPFDVKGYILPDHSTCILFRGLASGTQIEIKNADFEVVDAEISARKFDHICCYPPSFSFTKGEAKKRAKSDVKKDVKHVQQVRQMDAERSAKEYTIKSLRMLVVVAPWTARRKDGVQREEVKITSTTLKAKEGEDFASFSDRIKSLEASVVKGKPSPPPPETPPLETPPSQILPPETPSSETPPPETPSSETPPPAPPITVEAPEGIEVSTPQTTPQGTNISIEIKQPETPKGEVFDEKKDMEILRMKKTLYIQATDIENLRRRETEISNKLQSFEQMRQTVFRMNRRVYDTDAKVTRLEANDKELIKVIGEMQVEQQEENKKMRRFITEKARKARNQALMVAAVAIAISLISLPFLILLLIEFWDEIKSILGL
jgi:Ca2+/Na+ antiporter